MQRSSNVNFGLLFLGLLCLAPATWTLGQTATPKEPVKPTRPIISILGAILDYEKDNPTLEKQVVRDIAGRGITGCWDASPQTWDGPGMAENPKRIARSQRLIDLLHQNNLDVHYCVPWGCLMPADPGKNPPEWLTFQGLKKETGELVTATGFDYGNEKSREFFMNRCRELFKKVGPVEMFMVDEVIMAEPGDDCHVKTVSTYWSSPTYSPACLASFRNFLAKKGYPDAQTAKFPVTTVEVKPSNSCNMGLPAIKITRANQDRLIADNQWPNSPLWKHWYDWRSELHAKWVDAITTAAWEVWGNGKNPKWQGCAFNAPPHWYVPGLGPDPEKLAKLKHLDYIDSGYFGRLNYGKIKEVALRNGKKWGGTVELAYYGRPQGNPPGDIITRFKQMVNDGASIIFLYPTTAFQTNRDHLPEAQRTNGLYYMPEQIAAWKTCAEWLKTRK